MAKQNSSPVYELLYHPTIPGRGEFIRLAFEAAGVGYRDLGNGSEDDIKTVYTVCNNDGTHSSDGNPPVFATPALRITSPSSKPDGDVLVISQTPNILFYLGEEFGLLANDEIHKNKWHVQQVVLTALDLNNEIHDTHHPIASSKYYEEQKDEALKKATDVRETRLPKYFSYFDRVLRGNASRSKSQSRFLVGDTLSVADTTVWQVLDGLYFAFPREMAVRKKEFPELLTTFYDSVREVPRIKQYLTSERRLPYGNGVFRHYPELDRQG